MDSAFNYYVDSCVFNAREHCVLRDVSVRKWNLCNEFGFLDWNISFHKGCNHLNEVNEFLTNKSHQ